MLVKKYASVLLTLGLLSVAGAAWAQSEADRTKDKTILDRIDEFGKGIFGGILPSSDRTKPGAVVAPKNQPLSTRRPAVLEAYDDVDIPRTATPRAGSILSSSAKASPGSSAGSSLATDDDATEGLKPEKTPIQVPRESNTASIPSAAPPKALVESERLSKSPARPLHERLAAARRSVFEGKEDGTQQEIEPEPAAVGPVEPIQVAPKPMARPIIAQRTPPSAEIAEMPVPEQAATSSQATEPVAAPAETATQPTTKPESDTAALITRKGPVLSVQTFGPRRIVVGKESVYEVRMTNSGEVAGEELVVFVTLPEWAEVVGAQASSGTAGQMAGIVQWKLGRLDSKGQERLTLRIVPRQSRPFDLAVRWESKPAASQAMIEVQEPKLALQLQGPREILFGKKEIYRLKLSNTGTGGAENVAIMLMPIGGGENVPATHRLGALAAGKEKILDVELTARQAGNLTIQIDARADGGVHAELAEKVFVRRPDLKADLAGPKMQFVGAAASYSVRVSNPGTAPAHNVNVVVSLPPGVKYVSGVEGARLDAAGKLQWTLASLNPEIEHAYTLKCVLGSPGVGRFQLSATADGGLTASADAETRIDAVANLTMDVKDPDRPVAVGAEAVYEVRIRNRGARAAENVEVFAYFSRGIEPTGAEGGPNRIEPGQVIFQPIASLAPGAEAVLTVRARAEAAGNHVFRVESHCKPLGARLVSEATNLFYADAQVASEQQPAAGERLRDAMRPVQRNAQGD